MQRGYKFATWLQGQLRRREWTQADFARRLNVAPQVVSKWMLGQRLPDPHSCDLIADALSLDLDLVLWHAGHRPNLDVIDPDDPATTIISLAKRVDWSKPERFNLVEGIMRQWINIDHGEKMAARKDKE